MLLVSLTRCAKLRSPHCYLSLLPMTAIQTAFCCSCWWWPPGLQGVGLFSVTAAGDNLDCLLSLLLMTAIRTAFSLSLLLGMTWTASRFPNCHRWVLFTCQSVTQSLSFCCFTEPSYLSTQTWVFWVPAHDVGGPGEWITVEMLDQGAGIVPWKFQPISSTFTPSKSHSVLFGVPPPPSRWPSFEHSSTKMGSLDIEPVHSTLCPSITTTRSTSKFHFNTFQYSIEGAIMLHAITCGQDCTVK